MALVLFEEGDLSLVKVMVKGALLYSYEYQFIRSCCLQDPKKRLYVCVRQCHDGRLSGGCQQFTGLGHGAQIPVADIPTKETCVFQHARDNCNFPKSAPMHT